MYPLCIGLTPTNTSHLMHIGSEKYDNREDQLLCGPHENKKESCGPHLKNYIVASIIAAYTSGCDPVVLLDDLV
jgi:hypothetical protein